METNKNSQSASSGFTFSRVKDATKRVVKAFKPSSRVLVAGGKLAAVTGVGLAAYLSPTLNESINSFFEMKRSVSVGLCHEYHSAILVDPLLLDYCERIVDQFEMFDMYAVDTFLISLNHWLTFRDSLVKMADAMLQKKQSSLRRPLIRQTMRESLATQEERQQLEIDLSTYNRVLKAFDQHTEIVLYALYTMVVYQLTEPPKGDDAPLDRSDVKVLNTLYQLRDDVRDYLMDSFDHLTARLEDVGLRTPKVNPKQFSVRSMKGIFSKTNDPPQESREERIRKRNAYIQHKGKLEMMKQSVKSFSWKYHAPLRLTKGTRAVPHASLSYFTPTV